MTTFLALLPSPHAIKTDSTALLKKRLADAERVTCDYSKFTASDLREMAAAPVWWSDANTEINVQTLTALHAAQRVTLCRMFKIAVSSNVSAVVDSILVALGFPAGGGGDKDSAAPPAGSFLALLQTELPDE